MHAQVWVRARIQAFGSQYIGGLLLLLGTSSIYLLTVAPTVQGFDSAELTVGAYDLGLIHAPGYPLYMLIGHAFSQLPIGNVGLRLNLMSATFGILTVAVLAKLLLLETQNSLVAFTVAFLFATTPVFWSQATRAEVYTIHTFLCAGALLAWLDAQRFQRVSAYLLCFIFLGLGVGNHLTIVLLWLSTLVCARWSDPHWRRITICAVLMGLLIAVGCYLYFPWRSAATREVDYLRTYFSVNLNSPQGLWWLISGRMFRCAFYLDLTLPALWREITRFATQLWDSSLGIGVILGIWGWSRTRRSSPLWNRLLSTYFVANLIGFLIYHVVDKEVMFIPVYLVGAVWIANGIMGLTDWITARLQRPRRSIHILVNLMLLVSIAASVRLNWTSVDLGQNVRVYDFATDVVESAAPSTTIVNHWVTASVFDYLRVVEKRRPDVTSFNLDFFFLAQQTRCSAEDDKAAQQAWFSWLDDALEQQPLCFIEPLPAIPNNLHWIKQGVCWRVATTDAGN